MSKPREKTRGRRWNRERSHSAPFHQPKTLSNALQNHSCAPPPSGNVPPRPTHPSFTSTQRQNNVYYPNSLVAQDQFGRRPLLFPLAGKEQLKHRHHASCQLQVHSGRLTHTRSEHWAHPIWLPGMLWTGKWEKGSYLKLHSSVVV